MAGGIRLGTIPDERRLKLRSMLLDQVGVERANLLDAVAGDPLLAGVEPDLHPTLEYIEAQDYGARDLDRYYAAHPIRVARFLVGWSVSRADELGRERRIELLQAGLVHNAIEKKVLSREEAAARFGDWVADAVQTITVDRAAMATRAGVAAYYAALAASDPAVRALKIFDKFDNLFVICVHPDEAVRLAYIREIEEFLVPIIATTAPEIADYTTGLIESGRAIGHYRPAPEDL
jgi:hypothetical protein